MLDYRVRWRRHAPPGTCCSVERHPERAIACATNGVGFRPCNAAQRAATQQGMSQPKLTAFPTSPRSPRSQNGRNARRAFFRLFPAAFRLAWPSGSSAHSAEPACPSSPSRRSIQCIHFAPSTARAAAEHLRSARPNLAWARIGRGVDAGASGRRMQGSNELNISAVVTQGDATKSLRAVRDAPMHADQR